MTEKIIGITVPDEEGKDLTNIIEIIDKSWAADKMLWMVRYGDADLIKVQQLSGIANLKTKILNLDVFQWDDVKRFALGDYFAECDLIAFSNAEKAESFKLTDAPNLWSIFVELYDCTCWHFCAKDAALVERVESNLLHFERLDEDWFTRRFYKNADF